MWWLLTEMAGLVSIYWLMSYLSKDSFILEINLDLIWIYAEEKMIGGKGNSNLFSPSDGKFRRSKENLKDTVE